MRLNSFALLLGTLAGGAFVAFALARPAPAALSTSAVVDELPYESAARDFLASRGLKEKDVKSAKPTELNYEQLIGEHFVEIRLGLFDVRFPADGLEKRADNFQDACGALLTAQEKWLDWLKPLGRDQKALREDLATLSKWVKGLQTGALESARDPGGKDVYKLMGAQESVLGAAKRLGESMAHGEALGPAQEELPSVRVILMPTRKDFVEMASFAGWINPELRTQYWVENMADWTQCFIGYDQVIALEYTAPGRVAGTYGKGVKMNERDPTVMEQQVVQLALNSLFNYQYGDRVPLAFIQGLSMNLVIDQFGEISTRVDGDLREKSTAAREVFVPGGIEGGVLPPNVQETRFREDHGRDRFMRILRLAQHDGESLDKKAKNRLALFSVRGDNGGAQCPVSAPFLGSSAAATKPPTKEFNGDYLELLRAYKCGFTYWLQNFGAGKDKAESRARFALLLQKLADPLTQTGFEEVFAEVYDKSPLSGQSADKNTLEGKFLIWLSKQK